MNSKANLFDGLRDGAARPKEKIDYINQKVMMVKNNRMGVTGQSATIA
jgi:hypothetical protein